MVMSIYEDILITNIIFTQLLAISYYK